MTYGLTPDAVQVGLDAALPATFTLEEHGFGRGERGSASLAHLSVRPRFVLETVTRPRMVWPVGVRKAG